MKNALPSKKVLGVIYTVIALLFIVVVAGAIRDGMRLNADQAARIEEQLDHDETVEALAECRADNDHLWEQLENCFALRGDFCSVPPSYLRWWE